MIVVVPRLIGQVIGGTANAPVADVWGDTTIVLDEPQRRRHYRNEFTAATMETNSAGETVIEVAEALQDFPVAVLGGNSKHGP
jgi:maltooligosyltrehalose synthase